MLQPPSYEGPAQVCETNAPTQKSMTALMLSRSVIVTVKTGKLSRLGHSGRNQLGGLAAIFLVFEKLRSRLGLVLRMTLA